jgi:DNA-binding NarL/FixJ family response regulator
MASASTSSVRSKIRLAVVDDHPIMRDGLVRLFEFVEGIEVIGQAANGEDAIKLAREKNPDVMLLDINLPTINGLETASLLKAEFKSRLAVILLTAHDDQEQIIHAMRSGASAYCSKEIQVEALIETIRQVHVGAYLVHGKMHTERSLREWLAIQTEKLGNPYLDDGGEHFVPLSPREMEILRAVTRGLSNKEIALELKISHQTVKNHMTSVLDKLGVEDRTQAAVYALKRGWVRMITPSPAKEED